MKFKTPQSSESSTKASEKSAPPAAPSGKVKVICGIHSLPDLEIAGKTVKEVRKQLTSALNIGDEMAAVVNGNQVEGDYVLKADETLEFVRHAGSKG
jgi:hypothetical protein